ncbi:hypothetical protein FFF34_014120 [Inquilinus sp. KBS0705]|nr:hypothetical protein FFF34_014120 [Inquilinus sp. KBS0705]
MAVTIYAAYSFVPPPSAPYTTLNVVGYKGVYNSAWVGNVSAMMTTVMLSLWGFFLVTGGIKKDIDTEVGLIVATTPISNFGYLLSKCLSNFLVLLTIMGCTFVISIAMFFVRSGDYPFIISKFIVPFLLLAVPALLLISAIAIVGEVFLGRKSILQYILFVFLFGVIVAHANGEQNDTLGIITDPFGLRTMTASIKNLVNNQFHADITEVSFGFTFHSHNAFKTFVWEGISFSPVFCISRLLWVGISVGLVYSSSFFFHRFDIKQRSGKKKKAMASPQINHENLMPQGGITMANLPLVTTNYSIIPFIKTELLLMLRKGSKWFWLINAGLSISMLFAPLAIGHLYLLPILWFLQVTRLSELATKEKTNRLHYFTYASYKPLQRMLPAQVIAGIILALTLSLPLIARYAMIFNWYAIFNICNGAIFIVLLAVCLGIVSDGKKLFEVFFFLLTYMITQRATPLDYLGAMPHSNAMIYLLIILATNVVLVATSVFVRGYQSRHL